MNLLESLAGQTFGVSFGDDARALSVGELQQMAIRDAKLMANYKPSLQEILSMTNYRPPVIVPQGWADWYACGDQL